MAITVCAKAAEDGWSFRGEMRPVPNWAECQVQVARRPALKRTGLINSMNVCTELGSGQEPRACRSG